MPTFYFDFGQIDPTTAAPGSPTAPTDQQWVGHTRPQLAPPLEGPYVGGDFNPGPLIANPLSPFQPLLPGYPEGQPTPYLVPPDPEPEPDDEVVTSIEINRTSPPSPSEHYVNLVGVDDTVPLAYGDCWVRGKAWLFERSDTSTAQIFFGYVFAEGEAEDLDSIRIGDSEVALTDPSPPSNIRRNTSSGWTIYQGEPGQDVSRIFQTHLGPTYTDTHDGVVIGWGTFRGSELQGQPVLAIKGRWRKIYDPRGCNSIAANGSATTSDYFSVGDQVEHQPTDISAEVWVKLDSGATVAAAREFFWKRTGTTSGWSIGLNLSGEVETTLYAPASTGRTLTQDTGAYAVEADVPFHVAFTYDASTGDHALYINGNVVASASYGAQSIAHSSTDLIAAYEGVDYKIQDLRLWSDVRTALELYDSYRTHLEGDEAGLVGYWPVDDTAASSTVVDKHSNGNDLTKAATNVVVSGDHAVGLGPASWDIRAWSNNCALVCGDVAREATLKMTLARYVNWNDVAVTADHCDTDITTFPGVKRGTYDGIVDGAQNWLSQLRYVASHGFMEMFLDGDEIRFVPDWKVSSADHTIGEDDIVEGSISWVNGDPPYTESPDRVAVRYFSDADDEEGTAYDATPDGTERFVDLRKMLGLITHGGARRAAIRTKKLYELGPISFDLDVWDIGEQMTKWDTADITLGAPLSLTSQRFRLTAKPRMIHPGRHKLRIRLHDNDMYSETNDGAPTINLSSVPSVTAFPDPPPTPITVDVVNFSADVLRVTVNFDEIDFVHLAGYVFRVVDNAGTEVLTPDRFIRLASLDEISTNEWAVSGITRSGSTATATTSLSHPFSDGDTVQISGADQSEYNITATISNTTGTTFDYTVSGTPTTPATGTILANHPRELQALIDVPAQYNDFKVQIAMQNTIGTVDDFGTAVQVTAYSLPTPGVVSNIVVTDVGPVVVGEQDAIQVEVEWDAPDYFTWLGYKVNVYRATAQEVSNNSLTQMNSNYLDKTLFVNGPSSLLLDLAAPEQESENVEGGFASRAYFYQIGIIAYNAEGDESAEVIYDHGAGAANAGDKFIPVGFSSVYNPPIYSEIGFSVSGSYGAEGYAIRIFAVARVGGQSDYPYGTELMVYSSNANDEYVELLQTIFRAEGVWNTYPGCWDSEGVSTGIDEIYDLPMEHNAYRRFKLRLVWPGDQRADSENAVEGYNGTLSGEVTLDLPKTVASITRVSTTATLTTDVNHNFSNGDSITVEGADQSEYNGVFTISNVTATAFDYTVSGSPATPATGSSILCYNFY